MRVSTAVAPRRGLWATVLSRALSMATVAGLLSAEIAVRAVARMEPPSLALWTWRGCVAVWLLCGWAWLFLCWRRGRSRFVRVAACAGAVLVGVLGLGQLSHGRLVYQAAAARNAFRGYTVDINHTAHVVRITGAIGPGLSATVRRALDEPDIRTIEIDSIGGLIDVALDLANDVDRRGDVTVIADGSCDSACLLILLAGRTRLADAGMTLGFHAPVSAPGLGLDAAAVDQMSEPYYTFLVRHRLPPDILAHMKAHGPGTLYPVRAVDLVANGVLTAVTVDGAPVSLPLGRWMFMERALRAAPAEGPELAVLSAMRVADPDIVDRLAGPLYDAAVTHNSPQLAETLQPDVERLRRAATDSADPALAFALLKIVATQADLLARDQQWDACDRFVMHVAQSDRPSPLRRDLSRAALTTLAAMIRSAGQAHWVARPQPADIEQVGQAVLDGARRRLAPEGVAIDATDARGICLTRVRVALDLLGLDPITAIAVRRWLDHGGWPGQGMP